MTLTRPSEVLEYSTLCIYAHAKLGRYLQLQESEVENLALEAANEQLAVLVHRREVSYSGSPSHGGRARDERV